MQRLVFDHRLKATQTDFKVYKVYNVVRFIVTAVEIFTL